MRFINYIKESKKLSSTMIGFSVPFKEIEKTSQHIRSWLDRYNIKYNYNQKPHITIAQITGKYRKDKLTKAIQQTQTKLKFNLKTLNLFNGHYTGRTYIVLELKNNQKYREIVSWFNDNFPEFKGFPGGIKPHVSLINTELKAIDDYLMSEIMTTVPLPKEITTQGIDLYTSKFEVGYSFKGKK